MINPSESFSTKKMSLARIDERGQPSIFTFAVVSSVMQPITFWLTIFLVFGFISKRNDWSYVK